MLAIGAQRVQRLGRGDADPAPLAGRVAPDAVVPAELAALLVDDRAVRAVEPSPLEEGAIVVAGEEARLLALAALGDVEACGGRLRARLGLRQLAERELDPLELLGVELREHVRLVLVRIGRAREQPPAVALDDSRVVARPELPGAGPGREREQLVEAEAAVAAPARVRRLAARVPLDERLDDGAAELLAQIERHVREPERVTGLPGRDHGLRRAAGALGVGPLRIEPEPERDSDRLRAGAKERDGAVDAAAHRDGDPFGIGLRAEDLRERVRERVRGERLARHGGGLEQRQPGERAREARRVGVHDPVAVDREPHKGELLPTRRISDDFEHADQPSRLNIELVEPGREGGPSGVCAIEIRSRRFRSCDGKSAPPCRCFLPPMRTWLTRWVPCRTSTGEAYSGPRLP